MQFIKYMEHTARKCCVDIACLKNAIMLHSILDSERSDECKHFTLMCISFMPHHLLEQ